MTSTPSIFASSVASRSQHKTGCPGPLRVLALRLRPPVRITDPPADLIVERDVEVPMRDGCGCG